MQKSQTKTSLPWFFTATPGLKPRMWHPNLTPACTKTGQDCNPGSAKFVWELTDLNQKMELFGSCTEENTYSGFSSTTMYYTLKIKKMPHNVFTIILTKTHLKAYNLLFKI